MTEEVIAKDPYRAQFNVAQRAMLYNIETEKFCVAKVARIEGNFNKKYGPWDIFGGHIDADETIPEDAMRREVKEESGIEIISLDALSVIDFTGYGRDPEARRVLVGYLATCDTDEVEISDEHSEYKWLTYDEILEDTEIKEWVKNFAKEAKMKLEEKDAHNNMLRVLAEFDNYKKRSAEQQKDFAQYASQNVINEMLPVLDNFHAATGHIPEDQADNPWVTGIMYIQQQMDKVFEDQGVTEIKIEIGDEFDPETMEAIKKDDEEESEGDSKVTKVVQKGYKIKDKIMRPARVTVG